MIKPTSDNKPKFGALFDMDGVLIDTETSYTQFYEALEKIYPTGVDRFPYIIKGTTLDNILKTYFPEPEVAADVVRRLHEFEADMEYRIYPGVYRLLDILKTNGFATAIVTSSDSQKMTCLNRKQPDFLEHFDAVITAADVTRSKPDPQGYLLAAERIGVPIEQCFVFEDSLSGMAAGMASGATVVSVATTVKPELIIGKGHCMVDAVADVTVEMLSEVKKRHLSQLK